MMDLEIADYERTVEALNSKVTERDATITELRSEVERLEEKARGLKEQIGKISISLVQGEIIAKIVKISRRVHFCPIIVPGNFTHQRFYFV